MNKNDLIYTFNIIVNPKKFSIAHQKTLELCAYPSYLLIKQRKPIRIEYNNIESIELREGKIILIYHGGRIEFIISSTMENVTDGRQAELLIDLTGALKNKANISSVIESLRQAVEKKRKLARYIIIVVVLGILLFIVGSIFAVMNYDIIGLPMIFSFLGCLLLAVILSVIRSKPDISFQNAQFRINYHFIMARGYLDLLEKESDGSISNFYYEKATEHIEKIIEIDQSAKVLDILQKRISNYSFRLKN